MTSVLVREDQQNSPELEQLVTPRLARGLIAVGCAIVQFLFIHLGGFFLDDIFILGRAKEGLSFQYLMAADGTGHIQPVTRLIAWFVAVPLHTNYDGATALLAVFVAFGVYWLIGLLDATFGNKWWHLVLGAMVGTSWLIIATDQWFVAGGATAACVIGTGSMYAFCLWSRRGTKSAYAISLIAMVLAICCWEQALALPGWLALLWIAFLRNRRHSIRKVALALAPFFAVSAAFVFFEQSQSAHQPLTVPSIGQFVHLFAVMNGFALVPTLSASSMMIGVSTTTGWLELIGPGVIVLASILWLIARRRFRPTSVLFFLGSAVLIAVPIATARLTVGITTAGTTPRYVVWLPFIFAIAAAGVAIVNPAEHVKKHSTMFKVGVVVALAAVASLYGANLNRTFTLAGAYGRQMGDDASAISSRIASGLSAIGRAHSDSIVNTVLPFPLWYPNSGRFANLGPYWEPIDALGEGKRPVSIDPTGQFHLVKFVPGDGNQSPLYVHLILKAAKRTNAIVRVEAKDATQPESPIELPLKPTPMSFILPTWSEAVRSIGVQSHVKVTIVSERLGTIALGAPIGT